MLFDKKFYYEYTKKLKNEIGFTILINTILTGLIMLFIIILIDKIIPTEIAIAFAFITSLIIIIIDIYITKEKIEKIELKIQEMNWKLDIYTKIIEKEN